MMNRRFGGLPKTLKALPLGHYPYYLCTGMGHKRLDIISEFCY